MVNFLVIGTQKSGTTALYKYLSIHNEISLPKQKELHFFDNDENFTNSYIDYDKYHLHFFINNKTKAIGEITPIYIYWDSAIKRIWQYNPDMKIIVLFRNPIYRAYSHWNMESDRNCENLTFYNALKEEEKRAKSCLPNKDRVHSYIDRGYYVEQLRNIYRFFPKKQILVIKHEELKNNHKLVLSQISNFLDISPFKKQEKKSIHTREYKAPISLEAFNFLKKRYFWDIKQLEEILGWDCSNWLRKNEKIKVLFFRNFQGYTGGHQKVFDYFMHLKNDPRFEVSISFSKETLWNESNPWFPKYQQEISQFNLLDFDFLFIAGMDWLQLPNKLDIKIPIINLIQGIRHTEPQNTLYSFLSKKAYRICVSKEVTEALEKTNIVNGPIFTIPNGHQLQDIVCKEKIYDIYILGKKNNPLANNLTISLRKMNYKVYLSLENIPRKEVWSNMSKSRVSILLPHQTEGFYLPALESMKYSDITIVPDCIGNRSFCFHKINSLIPKYNENDILDNVKLAFDIIADDNLLQNYRLNAKKTLDKYTLESEKEKFFQIIDKIGIDNV